VAVPSAVESNVSEESDMRKATSLEGKTHVSSTAPVLEAFLYDFDVDWHELKSAHTRWLDNEVVKRIRQQATGLLDGQWFIWLFGNASTTGSDAHNLDLSRSRATEVSKYLHPRLGGWSYSLIPVAFGEGAAKRALWPDDVELDFYRSVSIVMGRYKTKPPTPDPPKPPPKPSLTEENLFAVRITSFSQVDGTLSRELLKRVSVGAGLAWVKIGLEVLDLARRQTASYIFTTLQILGRAGKSEIVSPEIPTPWGSLSASSTTWNGKGPWALFTDDRLTSAESLGTWWVRITELGRESVDLKLSPSMSVLEGFWNPKVIDLKRLKRPAGDPLQAEFFANPAFGGSPLTLTRKASAWEGPTPVDDLVKQLKQLKRHATRRKVLRQ